VLVRGRAAAEFEAESTMPQYKITPWKFTHELIQVRREIYRLGEAAPPLDLRRHAVDKIAAWKMRGHTPHAVESTALLMDAILLHEDGRGESSQLSVRAAYSAAFCRYVKDCRSWGPGC